MKFKIYFLNLIIIATIPISFLVSNIKELKAQQDSLDHTDLTLEIDRYIVGPGDILKMTIYGSPDLSGNFKVINDGSITVPFVGSVIVAGLTIDQANDKLTRLLSAELIDPAIHLEMIQERPIRVSITGEIRRPGIYTLTSSEKSGTRGGEETLINGSPTIVDLIQKSGGLIKTSDLTNIEIRRVLPGETTQYKKANINLLDLILNGSQLNNLY